MRGRLGLLVSGCTLVILAVLASGAMAKKPGLVLREGGHGLEGTGPALAEGAPIEVTMESSLGECSAVDGVMEMGPNGLSKDEVRESGQVWSTEDFSCQLEHEGGIYYTLGGGMREVILSHTGKVKFEGSMAFRENGPLGERCAWQFKYLPGTFPVPTPGKATDAVIRAKAKGHVGGAKTCAPRKQESEITFTLSDPGGSILEMTLG
jgi:hypothetical protein